MIIFKTIKWKNFFAISTIITVLHYGEDILLIWLGRFTEIKFSLLLLVPILFGLMIGFIAQLKWVKRYLNES